MKNTIGVVFIHGAGLGSYIWNSVLNHIKLPVIAIDVPATINSLSRETLTLNGYINIIVEQIQNFNKEQIILVAHSSGGILALTLTRYLQTQIIGLIGISAVFPKSGESFMSSQPFPMNIIFPALLNLFGTKPPNKAIRNNLCNDLSPEYSQIVLDNFKQESISLYTEKVFYDGLDTNVVYITLTNDKSLSPALQTKMADNLKIRKNIKLNSGHLPMMSIPQETANVLNEIIKDIILNRSN